MKRVILNSDENTGELIDFGELKPDPTPGDYDDRVSWADVIAHSDKEEGPDDLHGHRQNP
jgi:hypothetical protein